MNQLLDSLSYEPERGRLSLHTAPYVLVRPSLLVELQKRLETHLPQQVREIVAGAAQEEGIVLASRFREVFSYSAPEVLRSLAMMMAETGWGVASVEMMSDERMELVLKVTESPFADEYGPTTGPVCHYLLGLLQGAGIVLFEREVDGLEVQCAARGDGVCRFVITGKDG